MTEKQLLGILAGLFAGLLFTYAVLSGECVDLGLAGLNLAIGCNDHAEESVQRNRMGHRE